jgi:hypothetical protein
MLLFVARASAFRHDGPGRTSREGGAEVSTWRSTWFGTVKRSRNWSNPPNRSESGDALT